MSERAARRRVVLVVDDFEDNREMYIEYLSHHGFEALGAATGTQALELAFAHRPDAVLMDMSLPGLDGWEATRRLKADVRTAGTPVIALTGHVLAGHSQRAAEAGCDAFLSKPCLPELMLQTVRRFTAAEGAADDAT